MSRPFDENEFKALWKKSKHTQQQLKQSEMSAETTEATITKNQESLKGYWTDDEARGISLLVTKRGEATTRISLSSEYWYRVQHFDVLDTEVNTVWKLIKELIINECGRTLVPHVRKETVAGEEEGEIVEKQTVEYYRVSNLSAKQVDQLYYLLKHTLTKSGLTFALAHSFFGGMDTNHSIPVPKKRRRKKRNAIAITVSAAEKYENQN